MHNIAPKMVVLGMGYLAEYVMPCYEKLMGDKISENMWGVKGSDRGLKEKQESCPFPVSVRDGLDVLRKMKPDIIAIGVKPFQVAGIVEDTIAPYFDELRAAGKKLPIIYSFAPDPTVPFFIDHLGEDVLAVNMIPNMVRSVHGIDVAKVGVSFVAFDPRAKWDEFDRERAVHFLEPTGTMVEIAWDKAIPFLSCQCASHPMYEFAYIMQDVMAETGREISLTEAAQVYRNAMRTFFYDPDCDNIPSGIGGLDALMLPTVARIIWAWQEGVTKFAVSEDIDEKAARRMTLGSMEGYLMEAQLTDKKDLIRLTRSHATPGGFLEMCLTTLHKEGYGYITEVLRRAAEHGDTPDLEENIERIGFTVAKAISDHGKNTRNSRAERSGLEDIPLYRLED